MTFVKLREKKTLLFFTKIETIPTLLATLKAISNRFFLKKKQIEIDENSTEFVFVLLCFLFWLNPNRFDPE